jgi:hypothetical protein
VAESGFLFFFDEDDFGEDFTPPSLEETSRPLDSGLMGGVAGSSYIKSLK